jgi:hypothetical protein
VQKRVGCGCHLTRDVPSLLQAGGLQVERLETYYAPKEPKVFGALYEGTAVAAA